jgi:hypothetical protein
LKIRAAYKAVARLCGCKEKYQDFNFGTGIEPKGLEECEDVLRNLVAAFAVMTNSDWRPLTNSGPGSRGLNKNWMFENFVATLFSKSARTGRRLTFSRHNGTGTVLEAIRLLAPLLPPGFVPGPGALINSVRRAKKMAEEHAVWEREWEKEDLKKVGKKTFLRVKAWDQMKEEFESWQKKKGKGLTS